MLAKTSPLVMAACLSLLPISAQSDGTGTIEGRVFNPASGEYLRSAEVHVRGTSQIAVTGQDGRYRIPSVPAGNVILAVVFTGYQPVTAQVEVVAGQAAVRDFDLISWAAVGTEKIVALDKFTVSSQREGTAKALMEQRSAMTVKNNIASDTFGDLVEGNIAEVMQYLPGLEVNYDGPDPRSVSVRGLAPKYTSVMVDGVRVTGATGTREPILTNVSANAADTIEFSKTNSADMDADAPGGSLNLKSKSAFQRKGRYFAYSVYGLANRYQMRLGKSDGPNDGQSYKIQPGIVLDYSDTYLEGKLGLVLNLSEANSYNEQDIRILTYDTTPTAARPSPVMLTNVNYVNSPILARRVGGGLNVEYKLTPGIALALRGNVNWEDNRNHNRSFQLVSPRASQAPEANHLAMIANPTTNNATRFGIAGATSYRTRNSHSFAPSINYEGKQISADATFHYSRSAQVQRHGRTASGSASLSSTNMQLFGVGFRMDRSSAEDIRFNFQQTSGSDVYLLANWRASSLTNNMVRTATEPLNRQLVGQFNVKYTPEWNRSTYFKFGAKTLKNHFFQSSGSHSWTYIGPGRDRLTANIPVSVYRFHDWTGTNLFSGRKVELPDRQALGSMLQKNSEYFLRNPADATNAANTLSKRSATEYIDAAYLMANTRLGRVTLQGGIRYEATETRALVYERNAPTTRVGEDDDVFFSGAARYRLTDNLMALASFSQSMMRPQLTAKSAVAVINDANLSGTLPNPNLKPEFGDNYSVRLEYYFEPVGVLSASVFMMDIRDFQVSASGIPADELGLGDEYPGYLFTAMRNQGEFEIRGFELEYNQQLTFLPGVFRGLGVFANYGQTKYSDPNLAFERAPKTMSGGVTFRYLRLNSALRWSATPDTLASATTYRKSRHMFATSWSYKMTSRTELFLTGRNIFNSPATVYMRGYDGFVQTKSKYGSNWSLGVKGRF